MYLIIILNNRAEIQIGNTKILIDNWNQTSDRIKNSTIKLMLYALTELTKQNSFRKEILKTVKYKVAFQLTEYMNFKNIKNRKEARNQIKEDCEMILSITLNWDEKQSKDIKTFQFLKPIYLAELDKRGTIHLYFAPEFANYLTNAYEMKIPILYWQLNDKYNPNSSPYSGK